MSKDKNDIQGGSVGGVPIQETGEKRCPEIMAMQGMSQTGMHRGTVVFILKTDPE